MSEEGSDHVSDQIFKIGTVIIAVIVILSMYALVTRFADAKSTFVVSENKNIATAIEAGYNAKSYVWFESQSTANIAYDYKIAESIFSVQFEEVYSPIKLLIPQSKIEFVEKNPATKVNFVYDESADKIKATTYRAGFNIQEYQIGTRICPSFEKTSLKITSNDASFAQAISLGGTAKELRVTFVSQETNGLVIYTTPADYPIACALSNAIVKKANAVSISEKTRIMPIIVQIPNTELTFEGGSVFKQENSVDVFKSALLEVS